METPSPHETTPPARRTQQQRREATRRLLLEATVESLIARGYNGTTTLEIERRAGVSRGARIHHYPTKASLLADVVDHLYDRLSNSYADVFGETEPGKSAPNRVRSGLRALWQLFCTREQHAVLELNVAARTDEELRSRLREVAERHRELALQAAADQFALPGDVARPLVEALHAAMIGLLQRRNVFGADECEPAVLGLLEELVVSRLPQSAPSSQEPQ